MKRWLAIAPVIVLLALVVLFGVRSLKRNPQVTPMATVGRAIPDMTLPRLAPGAAPAPVRQAVKGPVLVVFFASWCAPCVEETPALMALKAEGVKMIGVAYKDAPDNSQAFLDRYGNPFSDVLVDRDGRAGIEFGVTGVPETYAVDARGVIRAKRAVGMTPQDAEGMLAAAASR